jgi:hypothetical protein
MEAAARATEPSSTPAPPQARQLTQPPRAKDVVAPEPEAKEAVGVPAHTPGPGGASPAHHTPAPPRRAAYLSLCSICDNQKELCATLASLLPSGLPIYLHLSAAPHLRDRGFAARAGSFGGALKRLLADHRGRIRVRFVENTGPYRKLLPLLREKWDEDCYIITVDDDTRYAPGLFAEMIRRADACGGECVVANRGFPLDWSAAPHVDYFARPAAGCCELHNFHTGKGAVLYRPATFRATADLLFDPQRFLALAPYNDDFWFNLLRIANRVPCRLTGLPYMTKDLTNGNALFANYNERRNNEQLAAVADMLRALGHDLRAHLGAAGEGGAEAVAAKSGPEAEEAPKPEAEPEAAWPPSPLPPPAPPGLAV